MILMIDVQLPPFCFELRSPSSQIIKPRIITLLGLLLRLAFKYTTD